MKQVLLISSFVLFNILAYSQDIIITKNLDTIHCTINSIDAYYVKYCVKTDSSVNYGSLPRSKVKTYKQFEESSSFHNDDPEVVIPQKNTRFAIGGGFAYMTGVIDNSLNSEMVEYIKKLKSGFTFFADGCVFINETYGIGAKYSLFKSKYEGRLSYNEIKDDMNTHFIAPGVYMRLPVVNSSNMFYMGAHLGYVFYKNNSIVNQTPLYITGSNIGLAYDISLDIKLETDMSFFIRAGYFISSLTSITYESGSMVDTIKPDKPESLSRLELTIGLSF